MFKGIFYKCSFFYSTTQYIVGNNEQKISKLCQKNKIKMTKQNLKLIFCCKMGSIFSVQHNNKIMIYMF